MTSSPSADNQPKDPQAAAPAEAGAAEFATTVQGFWAKNRTAILALCVVVLLAIVGREAWSYLSAQRDQGIREEYAKAVENPARLAAFAEANSGHALAGVAQLRLADEAFAKADYQGALAGYNKAASALGQDALKARARLGAAMSQIAGADKAAGETALKAIAADASLTAAIRAEATYHLASLALAAGRAEDVKKLADEVVKLDATGTWAQRAFVLRSQLPADAVAAPAPAAGLQFKPGGE